LREALRERDWGPSNPSRHRRPDRKTIQKILRGEEDVRPGVLDDLAVSLSKKVRTVSVLDIPGRD